MIRFGPFNPFLATVICSDVDRLVYFQKMISDAIVTPLFKNIEANCVQTILEELFVLEVLLRAPPFTYMSEEANDVVADSVTALRGFIQLLSPKDLKYEVAYNEIKSAPKSSEEQHYSGIL